MEVIIDIDSIDASKKEWLINTLKLMGINFQTSEKSQTVAEYNKDLENGNAEIERGDFTKASDIKKEADKW